MDRFDLVPEYVGARDLLESGRAQRRAQGFERGPAEAALAPRSSAVELLHGEPGRVFQLGPRQSSFPSRIVHPAAHLARDRVCAGATTRRGACMVAESLHGLVPTD